MNSCVGVGILLKTCRKLEIESIALHGMSMHAMAGIEIHILFNILKYTFLVE